mmetsp:Transcript_28976/g.56703  ORF Transcript_28976/g.56703 Transcript_28976/m.56703 type:complete len:374 (-) Transcript_28976:54-1175(-)
MDDELRQFGGTLVGIPPVPEKQTLQVSELGDREVSSQRGLLSLLPHDAHTHIRRQDHRHIVASIPDRTCSSAGVSSDRPHDICFLGRRAAATDHCWRSARRCDEELFVLSLEESRQDSSVNDENLLVCCQSEALQGLHPRGVSRVALCREDEEAMHRTLEPCRDSNADGRLHFISRQHPHAHVGVSESLQSHTDIDLESVLDSRQGQKGEAPLQGFDRPPHPPRSVSHGGAGLGVPGIEVCQLSGREDSGGDHESSQSRPPKVIAFLLQPRSPPCFDSLHHHRLCPLHVEDNPLLASTGPFLDDDSHALRFRRERKAVQNFILQPTPQRIHKDDPTFISVNQTQTDICSEFDQRHLIWGRCLELRLFFCALQC